MQNRPETTQDEPATDAPCATGAVHDVNEAVAEAAEKAAALPKRHGFQPLELRPKIFVLGVGGAGCNAVNNMIDQELVGVDFVAANTDAQALIYSRAEHRIQLGRETTRGLGAGGHPVVGEAAAEESAEELAELLAGANMVFIATGMGGGTGTGAAPVVARIARECGALAVCVVTKPFLFEGPAKMRKAEEGLLKLSEHVDAEIVIPNQNLYNVIDENASFVEAFREADEVLHQGVRSITDLVMRPGLVNLDFADVRTVMQDMGPAIMGAGEAAGDNRAMIAAEAAINNPLFDGVSVQGARSVLVNIASSGGVALREIDAAVSRVRAEALEDAHIASGVSIDPELEDRIRVSVVATGVSGAEARASVPSRQKADSVEAAPRASETPSRHAAPHMIRSAPQAGPVHAPQAGPVHAPQAPVSAAPQPVHTAPRSVETAPQPVHAAPQPVQTASRPVETAAPQPVSQMTASQLQPQPQSAPVAAAPAPLPATPSEVVVKAAPAPTPAPRPEPQPRRLETPTPRVAPAFAQERAPKPAIETPSAPTVEPARAADASEAPRAETRPETRLNARRPLGSIGLSRASRSSGLQEGRETGKALGSSLSGETARPLARDNVRIDPLDVDVPEFIRRQAAQ